MIGWFALTSLGWLAESFMAALVGKAVDRIVQQFGEQHGVEDDLEKLQDSLDHARLTISTIESLRIKDKGLQKKLKEFLTSLKDAAYDADDLLDEFQYRILKQQIEQQGNEAGNRASFSSYSTPPPSKKLKTSFSSYTSGLFGKGDDNNDDVRRIRKIKRRLDDNSVALEKIYSSLGVQDDRGKKQLVSSASRQMSSFWTKPRLFGRDKELQELKDLLLEPEAVSGQSGFSVLSIVGIGGIGKTTLAQEVFNDSSVKEYFELRIWVRVSENFSTEKLTREIIEYATKKNCNLPNFAALQDFLKEKITPERFLLVLDDVWNEDRHQWESLCAPLRSGKPGSKILVTTRSRKIAGMVGDLDAIHLEGLDEKCFWEFFKKCAFSSSNSGVHHYHLEAMAKKMIYKLKGLPLAAKTLGGLLSMKLDEQHWKSILDSEIWQLPQEEENGIIPALQLSYQYLPPHLKQCFAFCSLFPKNYSFSESKLISIWIAEGFIVPQGSIRMEELGNNYFHELVNRSFFQKIKSKGFIKQFGMHDLIHDLTELISVGESSRIEKSNFHEIPNTIRHLSVHQEEEGMQTRCLTEFSHYNKLRTLMLPRRYSNNSLLVDSSVLEKLKKIRVLILSKCALKELPDNIGKLIHIRYLDLSDNYDIRSLPESLCDLYNLQTLILYRCYKLESLPHDMVKLINLRKLDGVAPMFFLKITEVGKLTSLQNLPVFKVLKDNGYKLAELKGLKQLRGELRITNLENVENKGEANIANLKSKEHLDKLVLEWTSDSDVNLHISEQVLEGLQPHNNLQSLTIREYNGARPPNWLDEQVYSRLEKLELQNCKRWNDLSVIGQLSQLKRLYLGRTSVHTQNLHKLFDPIHCKFFFQLESLSLEGITMLEDLPNLGQLPCLEFLDIRSLPGVKMIGDRFFSTSEEGSCFPSLHTLHFNEMPAWEEFYCSEDRDLFPCLIELQISDCQNLRMLPPLSPSIELLQLSNVGLVDCPRFWKVIDESSNVTNSASITELFIQECPNLTILEQGLLAHHLQQIDIQKCEQLLWAPVKRLKELTSLESLSIKECPKLMSMTQDEYINFELPPSITQLCLSDCGNLSKSLPGCLHNLTSLRDLEISNCPNLVSLPVEQLLNLESVTIKNCNELRSVERLQIKSLHNLKIAGCPKLLLSQGEAQTEKSALQMLEIDDTAFMKQSVIKNLLSSVNYLRISSSCEAVMFEGDDQESLQSLTSLDSLSFSDCKNLQSLPTKLYTLTSLQILGIHYCPQIQSLPEKGLPPSLTNLYFHGCHLALEQQLERHLAGIKKFG
ncbi:putative disease resistance protein RGA4 [Zingiber officinale]|nr:putative disease resistance protein RGA4 [Zingiber officinale]